LNYPDAVHVLAVWRAEVQAALAKIDPAERTPSFALAWEMNRRRVQFINLGLVE
jgi:hypothetical protein